MIPVIPTKVHGTIDYIAAASLVLLPWLLGFTIYNGALWSMMVAGILIFLFSIVTRYETGAAGLISMRTHLFFDMALGAFIAAAPWLLNFASYTYLLHLVAGITILVIALITDPVPQEVHGPVLKPPVPRKNPERKWSSHH
jgi:hypothetical protein